MRVAAYTGGVMVPSARARVRQYIGPLNHLGIEVHEYPLPWGNILPRRLALRPLWIAATAAARAAALTCSWRADVTWISRQWLPAFTPLQAMAKRPIVLDVDDAVWLNTGGHRNHFRFQTDLLGASQDMDNTEGENLEALRALGERLADGPAFAEVCTRLGAVIAERAVLDEGVPLPAARARDVP